MKKLFTTCALASLVMLVGCSSPVKTAQKLITQQLKESLHDWNSYESVKFGSLDSVYTTFDDSREIVEAITKYANYVEERNKKIDEYIEADRFRTIESFKRKAEIALKESEILTDSLAKYKAISDSLLMSFVPEFHGWSMRHSFRANNLGGNKGIHHQEYYFDKDLTTILKSEDVGEK